MPETAESRPVTDYQPPDGFLRSDRLLCPAD